MIFTQLFETSLTLFFIAVWGMFILCRNIITLLMTLEILLLAVNISFVAFSLHTDDMVGQANTLFILTIAAAESSIGLAIIVIYYRARGLISLSTITNLKG
jgi:NADH-quinone oxidoreductase subunit K